MLAAGMDRPPPTRTVHDLGLAKALDLGERLVLAEACEGQERTGDG